MSNFYITEQCKECDGPMISDGMLKFCKEARTYPWGVRCKAFDGIPCTGNEKPLAKEGGDDDAG